jgi:hypothetical protein
MMQHSGAATLAAPQQIVDARSMGEDTHLEDGQPEVLSSRTGQAIIRSAGRKEK